MISFNIIISTNIISYCSRRAQPALILPLNQTYNDMKLVIHQKILKRSARIFARQGIAYKNSNVSMRVVPGWTSYLLCLGVLALCIVYV